MQNEDGLPMVVWLGILVGLTKLTDFIISVIGRLLGYVSSKEKESQELILDLEDRMSKEHAILSKKVDLLEVRISDNYHEMLVRDERLEVVFGEQLKGHEERMHYHIDRVAEGISDRISDLISLIRGKKE